MYMCDHKQTQDIQSEWNKCVYVTTAIALILPTEENLPATATCSLCQAAQISRTKRSELTFELAGEIYFPP